MDPRELEIEFLCASLAVRDIGSYEINSMIHAFAEHALIAKGSIISVHTDDAVSRILAASWNREGISAPHVEARICIAVNRLHRFRSRPWGPNIPLRKLFLRRVDSKLGIS